MENADELIAKGNVSRGGGVLTDKHLYRQMHCLQALVFYGIIMVYYKCMTRNQEGCL